MKFFRDARAVVFNGEMVVGVGGCDGDLDGACFFVVVLYGVADEV